MISPEDRAAPDPRQVLHRITDRDRGRLIAALAGALRDVDLAEDALSEAMESALIHWSRSGVPNRPGNWLLTVARRKALDRLRRAKRWREGPETVARLLEDEAQSRDTDPIPDERLRLIFACCHPALDHKSSVALTLRLLCGLSTDAIARAFLDQNATMGQRISRAKAKIAAARIPFAIPGPEDWPERLNAVLDVVYLIFNAGYVPPEGDDPARDYCLEAIYLARLIDRLCPDTPEIEGFLAMILFIHARRDARRGGATLDQQDPARWDRDLLREARATLDRAVMRRQAGPFQIQAAIQALHIDGGMDGATDWDQIVLLYSALRRHRDGPVIRLNQAVAMAEAGHSDAALQRLTALQADLDGYQPFHAARADLMARRGDADAAAEFERALALAQSEADKATLHDRRDRATVTARKKMAEHEARPKSNREV